MYKKAAVAVVLMASLSIDALGQDGLGASNRENQKTHSDNYLGQELPGLVPELFAPGIVSTGLHEHSAVLITPDGNDLFFTVADGAQHVILHIPKDKSGWLKPRVAPFSGQYKDDRPFFGPHGKRVYYSSRRPRSAGADAESRGGIWYVERKGSGWGEPKFEPALTALNIATPGFAANGNLYFCSAERGGQGREDLFVAKWENGAYAKPKSLGNSVNSESMEAWPYIAPDEGYIIFTSFGRSEGDGLYISVRDDEGRWTKARYLGPDVNISGTERFAWVSHDGKYLLFNRQWERHGASSSIPLTLEDLHNRSASPQNGLGDVYWVNTQILEKFKR